MKKEFKIIIGLIVACVIVAFIFIAFLKGNSNEKGYLKFIEYEMHSYDKYVIVDGMVKNVAEKNISYCEFRVKYYDKNNTYLGYSIGILHDIPAGSTADFSVSSSKFSEQVDHISFEVLSVFFEV